MGILELSGFFGFVLVVLVLIAIFKTLNSTAGFLGRAIWIGILLFFPLVGWLLWLVFGPGPQRTPSSAIPLRSTRP